VVQGDAPELKSFAVITVGLAVATADGGVLVVAAIDHVDAQTLEVCSATLDVADLTFITLEPGESTADLAIFHTLTVHTGETV
jgi:hypothetical protein